LSSVLRGNEQTEQKISDSTPTSVAMGCMASKSGEVASHTDSATLKIEQLLVDIRRSVQGQRQHGAAFVELGTQLALLDKLLIEQDFTGDKMMSHRASGRHAEQCAMALQPPLAEQLSMAQQAGAALQQQLEAAQASARKAAETLATASHYEAQLQEQVLSHQQHVLQLGGRPSTAQQDAAAVAHQGTACLQEQLDTVQQQVASLHQQVTASQQQVADLQAQLSIEQSRVAALEQALAELRTAFQQQATALGSAQQHIKQLQQAQQQQEDACATAAAQHKQLSTDLINLQESSKRGSKAMPQELQQHMAQVCCRMTVTY
jgi:chromosome segregation ATPase